MRNRSIAIIGAGVQGLAAARTFKALGYRVRVFEKLDDIGGTWHESKCYPGLTSHGPMIGILYPDFLPTYDLALGESIQRDDFVAYLKAYVAHYELSDLISPNSDVFEVTYKKQSTGDFVTLGVRNTQTNESSNHDFDYVIYTSVTTVPNVPDFENKEVFAGTIIHANQFTQATSDAAIKANRRILIVGGNKSAADVVLYLKRRAYKRYLWLHRSNSWGFNFDIFRSRRRTSLARRYFSFYTALYFGKSPLSRFLSALAFLPLRWFGVFINPFPQGHAHSAGFRGAVWKPEHLRELRASNHLRGEIASLGTNYAEIESQGSRTRVDADLIVCGTGFLSRKDSRFFVDTAAGKEEIFPDQHRYLFRSMVMPSMPSLVFLNSVISPGRITISAYLTLLWIAQEFIGSPRDAKSMEKEIDDDIAILGKYGLAEIHTAWRLYQRSNPIMIWKNCRAILSDLNLKTDEVRNIVLAGSPRQLDATFKTKLEELRRRGSDSSAQARLA